MNRPKSLRMGARRCRDLGDGVIACGGEPSEADLAMIEQLKRYMRGEMSLPERREFSGLTVGQAAKAANIPREQLEAFEQGKGELDDLQRRRLEKLLK